MAKLETAIALTQLAAQKLTTLSGDPIGLTQFVTGVGERALIAGGGLAAISLAIIWLATRGDKNRAKASTHLYEDTASSRDRRESETFVVPTRANDFLPPTIQQARVPSQRALSRRLDRTTTA